VRIASFRLTGEGDLRFGVVVDQANPCADVDVIDISDLTDVWNGVGCPLDLLVAANAGGRGAIDDAIRRAPLRQILVAQLEAPVPRPAKFIGIGFNYRAHAEEMGRGTDAAPVFFNKQVTCITGPRAEIPLPAASTMLDYEGELALVIGRRCRDVPVERAHEVIGGWLACDDVSARDWQRESSTVTLAKSHDGFGPIGPWLVTPDEIEDPQNLSVRTMVNGDLRQDGCTADMIHSVREQIAYLSARCTLQVGDLLTTGSPAGSAQGLTPSPWLRVGDVVRVLVEGIGVLQNTVVASAAETMIEPPPVVALLP
jgi:2-keto-4-pentenoate hydratase/2-oxohepta-3-ene-1,7-dioic acid hydratase in catechol pathway